MIKIVELWSSDQVVTDCTFDENTVFAVTRLG